MDMNARALRNIITGLGGKTGGVPRETGFNITAASEIMAVLCLSNDLMDLREKLGNIYVTWTDVIAFSPEGKEVLRITPPERPANCLLVGNTLYITARTGFYAIDLEVEGVR